MLLLSTAHRGQRNVMTMSWHSMLEFEPPLVGCVVSDRSLSHRLLRASGEERAEHPHREGSPTRWSAAATRTGTELDKFSRFALATRPAQQVAAPLLDACFASLECKVVDTGMVRQYAFFVLRGVAALGGPESEESAHAAPPRFRQLHGRRQDDPARGDALSGGYATQPPHTGNTWPTKQAAASLAR